MRRTAVLAAMLAVLVPGVLQAQTREPILAGSWYPGDPIELSSTIQAMLDKADPLKVEGDILGLVSPHAGYRYSGPTAAAGYKLLRKRTYDTVVVLAPSHRHRFSGASVYDRGPYKTPLGEVPLDAAFIDRLKKTADFVRHVPRAHAREHSLEIQLPFLQSVLQEFKLVPLVLGFQDAKRAREQAQALAKCAEDQSVLLVASTDLSHFHEAEQAEKMDRQLAECVERFDPQCLASRLRSGACEACGAGPLLTVLYAAATMGANEAVITAQTHSGDVTGDDSQVVGYLSAVLADDGSGRKEQLAEAESGDVSPADRERLKDIARGAIHARLMGSEHELPANISNELQQPSGAFVTLKRNGRLRGCIGHVAARAPLAETVAECAQAAAFKDPRFPPLGAEEFEDLEVEISVMSPLRRVSPEEVEVGRHGVLIRRGWRQGLLLPQVATEQSWDRETFLSQTCRKAGMGPKCWKDANTEIHVFSAEVF
jgi:hypothetical protein